MRKINKKNLKIINSINENGYYVIKDFFNKKKLKYIKNSLLNILNYIYLDNETDLQKKYYTVKKLFPKLKSHFYDIAPRDINLLQLLYSPEIVDIAKDFFKTTAIRKIQTQTEKISGVNLIGINLKPGEVKEIHFVPVRDGWYDFEGGQGIGIFATD